METAWTRWRDHLAGELTTLGESEFINTWAPSTMQERPPGFLGRPRKPVVVAGPTVCMLGMGTHVLIETDAAFPTGGTTDVSDDQRQLLNEAGWPMPGDPEYTSAGGPELSAYIPATEPGRAAELVTRTYRILGMTDPGGITVERGS
jgi:hypothetical protein